MLHRRHFLFAATLPVGAFALSTSVPVHLALAQQTSGKAEVKISELRPVVTTYVEHLSEAFKKHTGTELTPEEQKQMVEDTITKMTAEGYYAYVDP
jgi:hypothetical protein